MNIGERIEIKLKKEGRKKTWLAEKMNLPYTTLLDKLKKDTFDAYELLLLGVHLHIDLNALKEEIREEVEVMEKEDALSKIADYIKRGFTSGYSPTWELDCDNFSDLEESDWEVIANLVEDGFTSGLTPAEWSIKYEQ